MLVCKVNVHSRNNIEQALQHLQVNCVHKRLRSWLNRHFHSVIGEKAVGPAIEELFQMLKSSSSSLSLLQIAAKDSRI